MTSTGDTFRTIYYRTRSTSLLSSGERLQLPSAQTLCVAKGVQLFEETLLSRNLPRVELQ